MARAEGWRLRRGARRADFFLEAAERRDEADFAGVEAESSFSASLSLAEDFLREASLPEAAERAEGRIEGSVEPADFFFAELDFTAGAASSSRDASLFLFLAEPDFAAGALSSSSRAETFARDFLVAGDAEGFFLAVAGELLAGVDFFRGATLESCKAKAETGAKVSQAARRAASRRAGAKTGEGANLIYPLYDE